MVATAVFEFVVFFTQARMHWSTICDDYGSTSILCFRRNAWKRRCMPTNSSQILNTETNWGFLSTMQFGSIKHVCKFKATCPPSNPLTPPPRQSTPSLLKTGARACAVFNPLAHTSLLYTDRFCGSKICIVYDTSMNVTNVQKNNWNLSSMLRAEYQNTHWPSRTSM